MINIRKDIDAFGWGDLSWLDLGDDKAAAYIRKYKDCSILIINNLSGEPLNLEIRKEHIQSPVQDLLSDGNKGDKEVIKIPDFLNPYEYTWLRLI
jgi:hypothetical protein